MLVPHLLYEYAGVLAEQERQDDVYGEHLSADLTSVFTMFLYPSSYI